MINFDWKRARRSNDCKHLKSNFVQWKTSFYTISCKWSGSKRKREHVHCNGKHIYIIGHGDAVSFAFKPQNHFHWIIIWIKNDKFELIFQLIKALKCAYWPKIHEYSLVTQFSGIKMFVARLKIIETYLDYVILHMVELICITFCVFFGQHHPRNLFYKFFFYVIGVCSVLWFISDFNSIQ